MESKSMAIILYPKRGIGLIEVIVSVLVVVFAAGAGIGIIPFCKSIIIRASNLYQATEFSAQTLDILSILPYDSVELDATVAHTIPEADLPDCDLKIKYGGRVTYTVSEANWDETVPAANEGDYKVITVNTVWNDGNNHSVTLITIVGT